MKTLYIYYYIIGLIKIYNDKLAYSSDSDVINYIHNH